MKFQTPKHLTSDIHSTYTNKIPKLELGFIQAKKNMLNAVRELEYRRVGLR
jgi:hypothetical protein